MSATTALTHVLYDKRAKNGKHHPTCLYCFQSRDITSEQPCPMRLTYTTTWAESRQR